MQCRNVPSNGVWLNYHRRFKTQDSNKNYKEKKGFCSPSKFRQKSQVSVSPLPSLHGNLSSVNQTDEASRWDSPNRCSSLLPAHPCVQLAVSTEESQNSLRRLYSKTKLLHDLFPLLFSSTVTSSLMEEGDFLFVWFWSDFQLNFMSENHSMDLVVPLVIGCKEDPVN